ncbi:MAG: protein-disulfide reductase DsbD domain-containing protein, partial [Chitinophagaceae bacterium]
VSSYEGKVVFIQKITTKGAIKTNVAGEVEYMVCNNNRCLPPTKKTFNIKL